MNTIKTIRFELIEYQTSICIEMIWLNFSRIRLRSAYYNGRGARSMAPAPNIRQQGNSMAVIDYESQVQIIIFLRQ